MSKKIHTYEVGDSAFCSRAYNIKFSHNAFLLQLRFTIDLTLCSRVSRTLQGSANYVARPQTTGELASADVTAITKFSIASGLFKILGMCQNLFFKFVHVSAYYWNNQLLI